MVQYLRKVNKELGKTIIMVTHDPSIARVSDRILRINDGVVQADVSPTAESHDGHSGDYADHLRQRVSEIETTLAGLDSQFKQGVISGDEYVVQQTGFKQTVDVLRDELNRLGVVH